MNGAVYVRTSVGNSLERVEGKKTSTEKVPTPPIQRRTWYCRRGTRTEVDPTIGPLALGQAWCRGVQGTSLLSRRL